MEEQNQPLTQNVYTSSNRSPTTSPSNPPPQRVRVIHPDVGILSQIWSCIVRFTFQQIRDPLSVALQVLLPVVIVGAMAGVSTLSPSTVQPAENFVKAPTAPSTFANTTTFAPILTNYICYDDGTFYPAEYTGPKITSPIDPTNVSLIANDAFTRSLLYPCSTFYNLSSNFLYRNAPTVFPWTCSQQSAREYISPIGLCGFMDVFNPVSSKLMNVLKVTSIPTVNEMLLAQWAARLVQPFNPPDFLGSPRLGFALSISGYVYIAAGSPAQKTAAELLVGKLNASSSLFKNFAYMGIYDSVDQLTPRIRSTQFEGSTWAILSVKRFGSSSAPSAEQGFAVNLHLNRTSSGWTVNARQRLYNGGVKSANYLLLVSGFLTLEKAIGEAFAALLLNTVPNATTTNNLLSPDGTPVAVAPMPFPDYRVSTFLASAGSLMPLLLTLCLLYSVSQLVKSIVEEKEKKLRAGMQAMGLRRAAAATATLVVFLFQGLITASIITIILSATFLHQSDGSIIFVLFLFFCLSSSCFGVLMSVFFEKARISGIIAPIIFLMCAIPSVAIPQDTAASANRLLSFLSPSAFSLGMRLLVNYEQVQGMGWNDMGNKLDEVPMGFVLFMLLLDCFIYYFLALYLDNIMPNEWGIRRPCCYCCDCCCPDDHRESNSAQGGASSRRSISYGAVDSAGTPLLEPLVSAFPDEGVIEPFSATDIPVVSFHNVTKQYPGATKFAVSNFTMHFMEGQITCLLGANSCGKTTSVNMLTGMVDVTEGEISVCGHSVTRNILSVQQLIGICPQHNLLWDTLSCLHHLKFYAAIKGLPSDLAENRALQLLKIVDLDKKKDQTVAELSGGQKRRLCVAIAFVAGSSLVALDECSAGCDPPSRRGIWKLLQRMSKSRALGTDPETGEKYFDEPDYLKTGCSILLITHFLDECEILGDRVAIMSGGQLHSYGTPEYLKSKLGRGYTLRLTTKQALPPSGVKNLLNDVISDLDIPGATIGEAKAQEIMIRIPNAKISKIPAALRAYSDPSSAAAQKYKVEAVSIEVSTMEDVFLRIVDQEHARAESVLQLQQQQQQKSANGATAVHVENNNDNDNNVNHNTNDDQNQSLPKNIRDALDICFDRPAVPSANEKAPGGSFGVQFVALCTKRFHYLKRDRRTLVFQIVVPVICVFFGMLLTGIKPPQSALLDLEGMYLPESQQIVYTGFPCSTVAGRAVPQNESNLKITGVPTFSATTSSEFSQFLLDTARSHGGYERMAGWVCADSQQLTTTIASNIDVCSPITNAAALTTAACMRPSTVIFGNFSSAFSTGFGLAAWINAQVKRITTTNALPDMSIDFGDEPLPYSDREQSNLDMVSLLIGALFVSLPFGFVPSTFVAFIVREREIRAKLMQRLSGVNFGAFWLAHSVFDVCTFFLTELLALLIFVILSHKEYYESNSIGVMLVIFILNALATVGCGYCLSFLFQSHSSAQTLTMLLGFLSSFVFVIFGFVLDQLNVGYIRFIFRLFPPYCFGESLVAIALAHVQETSLNDPVDRWAMDNTDFISVGWPLLFLGIETIVFYIILFIVEFKSVWLPIVKCIDMKNLSKESASNPVPPDADETWDVKEEREHTESTSKQPDGNPFPLQVKQLRKVYHRTLASSIETDAQKKSNATDYGSGRVVAVKNLSFSVEQGTVLGFLGVNGAGKTTSMEIIVGANDATAGDCYVMGHSVTHEANITRQYIGYCPQFDALFDLLTCYEHLMMYCAIRGVDAARQDQVCTGLLEAVGLTQFRDIVAVSLSGGNKRKLSVAVSLVGGPRLLCLDECSAGIDTAARRILWDVIIYVAKKCAIVLTSHHLEEIEACASKVGIMVPGKFACFGPLGRIKASVGGGVEIKIKTKNSEELEEVERMLYAQAKQQAGLAPETTRELLELVEKVEGRITLRLPSEAAARVGISSANIFEWLLAMQFRKHFEFTVSNATIEQVFLAIASQQEAAEAGISSPNAKLASPVGPNFAEIGVARGSNGNKEGIYSPSASSDSTSNAPPLAIVIPTPNSNNNNNQQEHHSSSAPKKRMVSDDEFDL